MRKILALTFLFNINALFAQSVGKLEQRAINWSHITAVNGDTIQQFTVTRRQPKPRLFRLYYWKGQNHIQRAVGAYNGRLLHGPYYLTDRDNHLLGSGSFRKGLKTGLWRTWRPDGSLASANRWRHGQQRGRTIVYDINSRPIAGPIALAKPKTAAKLAPHWWQPAYWKKSATTKTVPVAPEAAPAQKRPLKPKVLRRKEAPKSGA